MAEFIRDFPPNIEQIRYHLDPPAWTVFTYGSAIYAPNHDELYPDIIHHEQVHQKQQLGYRNPGEWWDIYLNDSEFRKEMEIEAYSAQYEWLKERISNKDLKLALTEMAISLTMWYNIPLSVQRAENLIRNYAKKKA